MRLFAALWPPAEAVTELARFTRALTRLPGAGELRWTTPESWHFTLSFYGEVPEEQADELGARLARVAHRARGPVPLRLAAGGRFGDRALWAGVHQDTDRAALTRLAAATTAAGRRAGVLPADAHPSFRAHLTLARARNRPTTDLRPYVAQLEPFAGSSWGARDLLLVRSELPTSGVSGAQPRYEPVGRWPLGG
ncbi:RNA 2',3'-cyclic phosphodiesterase [Streptomyces tubbatahanensis]|uniref:RNA 2',3'-cyclic phosphodiesterase n=1 Tax=Streptomyces tubbatahanensis TaxID=2923272 RepID=A0ABY3XTQ8_9ACTN|nr:RNA 2',3'-cyclic phosphodiesterase [Streptomyces tubbatahanensis]UNS97598.1 RNA 2',3'-cyclic phosphodiesterase [Streptomyces tubbatahanensis]